MNCCHPVRSLCFLSLAAIAAGASRLKQSMDKRAADRDRITGELQVAEVKIAETRLSLKELEQQRTYSENRKRELDGELLQRTAELERESRQLGAQVRAAYTSGQQERMQLLLNQHDPATLGRQMAYYRYFSEFRSRNIATVHGHIRELGELRRRVTAEESRIAGLARARAAELHTLNASQQERRDLLVALKARIAQEGSEIDRLAAQEQDLARLITELTTILSDYPITAEERAARAGNSRHLPRQGDFRRLAGGHGTAGHCRSWRGVYDTLRLQRNHAENRGRLGRAGRRHRNRGRQRRTNPRWPVLRDSPRNTAVKPCLVGQQETHRQ